MPPFSVLYPVRSFVRRQGRMTDSQRRNLDIPWSRYGLEVSAEVLDLATVFGRRAPVWLEIGFGTGDFLANLAAAHPSVDFLGIDVHRPGIGSLCGRLQAEGLTNVRLFCADAVEVLQCCIPNEVFDQVYVLFPDPWPKQRHHKRRLIQSDFAALLRTKSVVGGQLHLATDWEDYAKQMMTVLSKAPGWWNPLGLGTFSSRLPERFPTRFESRGLRLGHGVWDLTFIRKG